MDIILKQDVDNLGYKGDLVNVKDGYARNFLIPKGKAVYASPGQLKMLEENKRQQAHKEEKVRKEAEAMVEKLKSMKVKVGAKVGESGKIFGSVNTIQLAEEIKKLGFDIDRKNISIQEEPIKSVGTYTAEVTLHRDIKETISFEVVED